MGAGVSGSPSVVGDRAARRQLRGGLEHPNTAAREGRAGLVEWAETDYGWLAWAEKEFDRLLGREITADGKVRKVPGWCPSEPWAAAVVAGQSYPPPADPPSAQMPRCRNPACRVHFARDPAKPDCPICDDCYLAALREHLLHRLPRSPSGIALAAIRRYKVRLETSEYRRQLFADEPPPVIEDEPDKT